MRNSIRIAVVAGLALGAASVSAHAQAKTFGIVAGVSISNWTGSDAAGGTIIDPDLGTATVSTSSLVGFTGGFFVNIPMGTSLAFEPELLYAGKGMKYDVSLTDPILGSFSGDVSVSMGYIEVPLLVRYNFQSTGGPYLLLGPDVGFNLSCSLSGGGDFQASGTDCGSDAATSVTFGGVGGLGFQRKNFGLEARYDFDFSNALQEVDGDQANVKNASWEILLRYQFK